jgi:hypothetical protein
VRSIFPEFADWTKIGVGVGAGILVVLLVAVTVNSFWLIRSLQKNKNQKRLHQAQQEAEKKTLISKIPIDPQQRSGRTSDQ